MSTPDPMATVPIMTDTTIDTDTVRAALLTLTERDALDLAPILGLTEDERQPRTGHLKGTRDRQRVMQRRTRAQGAGPC